MTGIVPRETLIVTGYRTSWTHLFVDQVSDLLAGNRSIPTEQGIYIPAGAVVEFYSSEVRRRMDQEYLDRVEAEKNRPPSVGSPKWDKERWYRPFMFWIER
jgi:hypothetical protein